MKNQKGFTLIEMVIVLAIIGILGAAAYPRITGYMETQKEQYRQNQEYVLNKALKQYYAFTGRFPQALNDGTLTAGELDSFFNDIYEETSVMISRGNYGYTYIPADNKISVTG